MVGKADSKDMLAIKELARTFSWGPVEKTLGREAKMVTVRSGGVTRETTRKGPGL